MLPNGASALWHHEPAVAAFDLYILERLMILILIGKQKSEALPVSD
jgi:hypothetical protein